MERRKIPEKNNPAQKMAKNMSRFTFAMCLIVIAVIFVFYQYKNGGGIDLGSNNTVQTEVDKLATKDLELGYPATPAEVMKLFGRINQCMYNKGVEEDEFDQLLAQLRMLYSTSLLEQNSFEEQKSSMKSEVENFSTNKRKIANYTVDKSSSVKYKTINGQECAYIQMAYFLNENGNYMKSFQNYILVKEEKHWKILAFKKGEVPKEEKKNS